MVDVLLKRNAWDPIAFATPHRRADRRSVGTHHRADRENINNLVNVPIGTRSVEISTIRREETDNFHALLGAVGRAIQNLIARLD
jgi:hypothetical protein